MLPCLLYFRGLMANDNSYIANKTTSKLPGWRHAHCGPHWRAMQQCTTMYLGLREACLNATASRHKACRASSAGVMKATGALCLGLCALLIAGASAERLLLQGNTRVHLLHRPSLESIFCYLLVSGLCFDVQKRQSVFH